MVEPKFPVDVPQPPLTALSTPSVGKGSIPAANTARDEVWATNRRIHRDNVPYITCVAIWGKGVVDARRTADCPLCGFAGDIFVLCPYHQSRECPDCHGIWGTVASCRCP